MKHPAAIARNITALKDLSCPQKFEREKKHPARYSQSQPKPISPATAPIGDKTTKPRTNCAIAADFPAIVAYNLSMLDEENNRLKGLLIATTGMYFLGWIIGLLLNRLVNSESFIIWTYEYSWVNYVTWFFLFVGFCWIPLSIFLLVQGFILKKKYSEQSYTGDKTIGNLSVLLPVVFFAIYIATRILYGF